METIKFLRRGKGWTQEQLASAVGVKRAVISKYESGAISPSYEMIQKIADALHVPITELINPPFEAVLSDEICLMLQGWRPCAYHGGRFLHRGEWEPGKWYEFMARDGTVFTARMKEDAHIDCFYPKAERKENEVWFYRECR